MNTITMIPIEQLLHHPENPRKDLGDLKEMYQFLREIGYVMSDLEQQLMDGTHEVFKDC